MPDHPHTNPSTPRGDDSLSNTLESRLDALGRGMVSDEARRAQPSPEFLSAVARRGVATTAATWVPSLVIAAAVIALIIYLIIRTGGTPQMPPPSPPSKAGEDHSAQTGFATPTFGWLWANNREASVSDLRLPGSGNNSTLTPEDPTTAADSRDADRVNQLLKPQ